MCKVIWAMHVRFKVSKISKNTVYHKDNYLTISIQVAELKC